MPVCAARWWSKSGWNLHSETSCYLIFYLGDHNLSPQKQADELTDQLALELRSRILIPFAPQSAGL